VRRGYAGKAWDFANFTIDTKAQSKTIATQLIVEFKPAL
jgi:hypothetical protein